MNKTQEEATPSSSQESLLSQAQQSIQNSPFTGCARQSFMWGIGTGAAMGLHRWRMGSRLSFIKNSFFGTVALIASSGYYLCSTERIWKEKNIEMMMKASSIKPSEEMPEGVSLDDHPFLDRVVVEGEGNDGSSGTGEQSNDTVKSLERELMVYEKKQGSVSGFQNTDGSSTKRS